MSTNTPRTIKPSKEGTFESNKLKLLIIGKTSELLPFYYLITLDRIIV